MKILGLDLATVTGWAYRDGDFLDSGVWDFTLKKGHTNGYRLARFYAELDEFIRFEELDLVAYERPGNLFGHARKIIPAFQGITEMWCHQNRIECECHGTTEVKKHATGKGNAKKKEMMEACQRKWPNIDLATHDQADALWVLDFAIHQRRRG